MLPTENANLPVHMTPEAIQKALDMRSENPGWAGLALRLYIEGKGCDGFYYGVSFDAPAAGDVRFVKASADQSFDLVIDPDTYYFVYGSTIQWVDDERGAGFLVDNPRQKLFRGKFYKRKSWIARVERASLLKAGASAAAST